MTQLFVAALLVFSGLTAHAAADDAEIHFKDGNVKKVMKKISDNRVSGSLESFRTFGAGEDEDFADYCFKGSPKDVCKLLEIGAAELSDKSDTNYKLRCEKNKYGISWSVHNHTDQFGSGIGGVLPPCR